MTDSWSINLVLFGHVVEGIEILDTINSFASLNVPITIVDCGKIP